MLVGSGSFSPLALQCIPCYPHAEWRPCHHDFVIRLPFSYHRCVLVLTRVP